LFIIPERQAVAFFYDRQFLPCDEQRPNLLGHAIETLGQLPQFIAEYALKGVKWDRPVGGPRGGFLARRRELENRG